MWFDFYWNLVFIIIVNFLMLSNLYKIYNIENYFRIFGLYID